MSIQADPKDKPDLNSACDPASVGDPYRYMNGDPESEPPWQPGETYVAWCQESYRLDAFLKTLMMLDASSAIDVIDYYDPNEPSRQTDALSVADATDLLRREYAQTGSAHVRFEVSAPTTGRSFVIHIRMPSPAAGLGGQIEVTPRWSGEPLYYAPIPHLKHRTRPSVEVEAGVAYTAWFMDAYELLVHLCTSSPAIVTGGCDSGNWGLATTNAASYHADGYTARDLGRVWWHLTHPESTFLTAGVSLAELRSCVEASPRGLCLSPARGVWLTREEVLAVMDLPKEDLLTALEVCADELPLEWRTIDAEVNRVRRGVEHAAASDLEWSYMSHKHIPFLRNHTPSTVNRLDNGAVVLFAHPYRTLWPLWASALDLLGIRPKTA